MQFLHTTLDEIERSQKSGDADLPGARTSQNEQDSNKPSSAVRGVLAGNARLCERAFGYAWSAKDSSAPVMISREIPSSGEPLPVIGVGTWQTFDIERGSAEQRTLQEVVRTFVNLGGRLIDSSPMYGRSETVVGEISATSSLRNRLFLATKVWTTGKQAGIRQMEESFHKLRVTRMDLMQVHNLVDVGTQLETLRQWKQEGRIRYLGITHYTAGARNAMARLIASEPLDFIQINYSVGEREAERRLLPLARERRRRGNSEPTFCGRRPFPEAYEISRFLNGLLRSTALHGRRSFSSLPFQTRRLLA